MANKTMHHTVIGPDTFELVDQSARADVSELKNALDDIEEFVTPENIFDKSTMAEVGKWWKNTNPVSTETAAAYTAIKIPIDNPTNVTIKQEMTVGNVGLFEWYAVDANMANITKERPGTPSIANGYTISNIPSTAKYLLLSLLYYAGAEAEEKHLSVVIGTTAKDYTPYFTPYYRLVIPDESVSTSAIIDGSVIPEKTSFMTLNHGENLFDFSTMALENKWYTGFTVGNTANLKNLDSQFHDIYIAFQIPLWKTEAFTLSVASNSNANIYKAALVDANDTVLSVVVAGETALKNGIVVTTVPQNAVAIYGTIQYWKSDLVDKNIGMMVSYGTTAKDYVPYIAPWWDAPNKKGEEAYDLAIALEANKRSVMYISKETNDTALLLKMLDAFNKGNTDVVFEKSTYTLSEAYVYMWNTLMWRWGDGLPVGNGCRYYFNDSIIISNPPSNPPEGSNGERNVIDCRTRGTDYELHDVMLINNGGRYCIHDEGNNSKTPYCHKYENVVMIYNKTELTPDTGAKAFGCGTGFDATLIFDGCVFRNENGQEITPLTIHAPTTNPDHDPCKLHLIMKNSYINNGTIYINVFDGTRDTLDFFLFGNKFGEAFSDPIVNLIENNNTVIA